MQPLITGTGLHLSKIKRTGIWFAFAAWLMQISVFLTPIFADQVSVGHGVCVQLAEVVEQMNHGHVGAHASLEHAQHTRQLLQESIHDSVHDSAAKPVPPDALTSAHSGRSDSRRLPDDADPKNQTKTQSKQLITQDHITPPSTAPPSDLTHASTVTGNATHHTAQAIDTAQCGFCLLIGHSVLPPVPDAQLQAVAFFDLLTTGFLNALDQALGSLRGLIPQSRAPPILV